MRSISECPSHFSPRAKDLLLEHGASLDYRTDLGSSVLTNICENEDGDPELLQYLLKRQMRTSVNYRLRGRTNKWRIILRLARFRRMESQICKEGFLKLGIPGSCSALIIAMTVSSPDIIQLLLENGANASATDITGNNPLMVACTYNNVNNVKFWLKEFPDWDLEARNNVVGGIALGCAVYMGPNRFELTKLLLKHGAKIDTVTDTGSSILISACANTDADPRVVKLLLKTHHHHKVNYQRRATTMKWKSIRMVAKTTVRTMSNPGLLMTRIGEEAGATALHESVRRMGANKLETVKVLLDAGASLNYRTFGGGNVLTGAVENEDSDPEVVRLILENLKSTHISEQLSSIVNYRRTPTTFKWKGIYFVAKSLYRTSLSTSGLMKHLAMEVGTTSLNLAVARGDIEIVKILLENGADPYIENDLGMNAFEVCEKFGPFPRIGDVLMENED